MIALLWREVVTNVRLWLAAGPLIGLTAGLLTVVFSLPSGGESLAEEEVGLMDQYDATLLAFILLTSMAATAVAVYQVSVRTRRRTAYLAVAGLPPTTASGHFTRQVLAVCSVASLAGIGVGWASAPAASQFIAWASSGRDDLVGRTDTHAIVGAAVITFGVTLIASTRGAQVARDVEPVEAFKPQPFRPRRGARWRARIGVASGLGSLAAGVIALYLPAVRALHYQAVEAANVGATWAAVMAALLAVFFALTAPIYCPFLIRAWTFFVPERRMPALFLGRRGAAYQAGRSLEAFNVILVGALLVGAAISIYFARSALDPAGRGWVEARDVSGVVLAAVPVLIAMTSSVMTVLATARSREVEAQVLRLSGATGRQVLVAGFAEAFILAVTATAVALVGVALVGLCVGLGLARVDGSPEWPGTLGFDALVWLAPLGVTVFGMLLVTLATLPSLVKGLRGPFAPTR
ncbi:MAG: hypothetical protein LBD90_00470 [Bifidobacteriaceae bacterium]|jgi:hypothetical protein|nr:hypothetical protein [Bifidobacteriaceae bacterium]